MEYLDIRLKFGAKVVPLGALASSHAQFSCNSQDGACMDLAAPRGKCCGSLSSHCLSLS